MVDNGIISRKQRGEYVLQSNPISEKQIYKPLMNEQLQEVSEKIEARFPHVNFVCFSSVQLNEFLNHLIGRKGAYKTEEGCLSLDGVRPCTRYKEIEVDYLDQNFNPQHGKYTDCTAQIIQHELDHVNGVVI